MALSVDLADVKSHIVAEKPGGDEGRIFQLNDVSNLPLYGSGDSSSRAIAQKRLQGNIMYKHYKRQLPTAVCHLQHLIDLYDELDPKMRGYLDLLCAWPIVTVRKGADCTGFLMRDMNMQRNKQPAVNEVWQSRECITCGQLTTWLQDEHTLMTMGSPRIPFTDKGRITFATNLLQYYTFIHALGLVVGDISDTNVLAYVPVPERQPKECLPRLIEVETYRFEHSLPPAPQNDSPNFIPPEHSIEISDDTAVDSYANAHDQARAAMQTKATDVYKAALIILRLFDDEPGDEASANRYYEKPGERYALHRHISDRLNPRIADALLAALSESPADRPAMKELSELFTSFIRHAARA